jgi:dihydrofolate reductase
MKAIIAVNNLGYIGKNNTLPWYCKEDLKHFKNKTLHQTCLVGYNTSLLLPPLKYRRIVVDKKDGFKHNATWCIGGKKTYEKYCHLFKEIHISHIDDNTVGDVKFPFLANLDKNCKIYNYNF